MLPLWSASPCRAVSSTGDVVTEQAGMVRSEKAVVTPQREPVELRAQSQEVAGGERFEPPCPAGRVVFENEARDLVPFCGRVAVGIEVVLEVEGRPGVECVTGSDA